MSNHNKKFSHRLFNQYFISAIIPVIVLALISFYTVSGLLQQNANRQIYAESRAIGLTIFDRFQTLDNNLLDLSKVVNDPASLKSNEWLKVMYSSLYVANAGEIAGVFHGENMLALTLSEQQQKYLNENERLLLMDTSNGNHGELLMLRSLDSASDSVLVAVLNPEYLWNIIIKKTDQFCIVIQQKFFLYCSNQHLKTANNKQLNDALRTNSKEELPEVDSDNETYLANVWELFLEGSFGMAPLSIVYLMPKKEALQDYTYYVDAFPGAIAITLLLVFVFSSIQMRRSLKPLMALTKSAKNLMTGDFSKTVELDSNDEFGALAATFNDMSDRINDQFNKIKTLAKIDRLILTTPDADYIAEVLLGFIPTVISADNAAILLISTESLQPNVLIYNEGTANGNLKKTNIVISEPELKEIFDTDKTLIKTSIENNSYLTPLLKLGCSYFMISPLKDKDDILGAICIGMINESQDSDVVVEHLSEISDRAAVALSNANWEKKLLHQANFDALTKLPNRYLFHDRLEQALERAKRKELNVAVLFIDLDRFKSVNDSLGHVIGDQLLVGVSNVLLNCVRSCDSVSRFGGDEFTIIVSDVSNEEVDEQTSALSDRIIEMMSQPIIINDREFYISPSIGIAIYPRDANNFNDLLKNADTAMYEAKNISSGNYQFYQKQQNKETLARLELENDLRHALEEGQLELHYQPKINLRNCMIYDVEALARWKHPDHGYVSPTVFIPLAEETGLIVNIGYWVMRTACMQNKAWRDKGINLNVAVNVSADQFRQPQLYENMVNIIEETGVNPNSIELEITESITIEDFSKTINVLNKFREHGLGICIDDFGTGYSSMTYLQKIPFNKLKIDKSFIDNIHLDNDSASITKAILALAHNLDLKVVAEGVETKAQYDYLNAINCDEAQGFFLSRPLPADELIQHILLYNNRSTKID